MNPNMEEGMGAAAWLVIMAGIAIAVVIGAAIYAPDAGTWAPTGGRSGNTSRSPPPTVSIMDSYLYRKHQP